MCNAGDLLGPVWWQDPGESLFVVVHFNTSLDARLDGAANPGHIDGDENTRKAVFFKAIDDWNLALARVSATVKLVGDTTGTGAPDFARDLWAGDQDTVLCAEQDSMGIASGFDVFHRTYANHEGDGDNVVSTGHNHGGVNLDPAMLPLDAGWIASDLMITDLTDLLGETNVQENNAATPCIVEADILWFTHFEHSFPTCLRIAWDYTGPVAPCAMDALDPNYFDFYSVILHELGHLLGLNHFSHGDPLCHNVMTGRLFKRERQIITSKEDACLKAMYGNGGAVGIPDRPPTRRLLTASPNPFSDRTSLDLNLAVGEKMRLQIFDSSGRMVRALLSGVADAVSKTVVWDGRDDSDRQLPSGVYFARIQTGRLWTARRIVLVRD